MQAPFEVPEDEALESILGAHPKAGAEVGVRLLYLRSADEYDVTVTTDVVAASVHLMVSRVGDPVFELTREGAQRLLVSASTPELVFHFRTGDTVGRLEIRLTPRLTITESSLLG